MKQYLASADWLIMPETRAVMSALETAHAGGARFVGGCVRNALMDRPVDDIDIATQLEPEDALKALKNAGIRAIPTGIEHGTVTAIVNHIPFEITSLRRDVETDGRRAVVAFTSDWAEDAQRRDFRLNAIYADANGKLYDPTGGGLEDASKGRVIFIGDGDQRLREDYLRILRFFRFNAWYGAEIDAEGLAACKRQKDGLEKIAAERIWKEFKKTLAAPNPADVFKAMAQAGVLDAILPDWRHAGEPMAGPMGGGVEAAGYITRMAETETRFACAPDPMARLMALLPRARTAVDNTVRRLKLSNAEQDRLQAWVGVDGTYKADREVRVGQYRFGHQAMLDWAASIGDVPVWKILLDHPQVPVFPLKGADLLKAGLKPGPAMGETLRDMEDWWIAGDFTPQRAELMAELERRLKAD